jgi:hypothetical protein
MEQESSIARWNRLYEGVPEHLRFWLVVWILIGVGAINMMLTIWLGFPFGLLVVIAIAAMAYIRFAPQLNLPEQPAPQLLQSQPGMAEDDETTVLSGWKNAFPTFNGWMDNIGELPRLGVHLGVLVVAGIINMLLSINSEFPFGILVLIALLALALIRGPWVRARTRAQYREFRAKRQPKPAALLPSASPEASGDVHAGMPGPGPTTAAATPPSQADGERRPAGRPGGVRIPPHGPLVMMP